MKLKWKPALFTLFLPSGDNLRLGGRPTPPWKVFGQGIFDLPCHYFACEEAKPRCRGVGMSKHLVGSIQCDGHNVPPSVDLTRTFQTTTKYNNINNVWSQLYKILVVLKYTRHQWANIFDKDICRSINIPEKAKYVHLFNVEIYSSKNVCIKDIGSWGQCYFKTTKKNYKWLQTQFI